MSQVEVQLAKLQAWMTGVVVCVIVVAISVMAFMTWQAYRVGENAQQLKTVAVETHGSLCALRKDLASRNADGVQYLKDHPSGLTAHGEVVITAAQIQRSLNSQEATLRALSGLDCS